jgi:hypothetical protein
MGGLGGGLSALAAGLGQKRGLENQFESQLAMDKNLNPNRRLNAGISRNIGGNLRANMGDMITNAGEGGIAGMSGNDFMRGLADVYLRSASQGINPKYQEEAFNAAGIPGLFAPDIRPDLKGPGIGESLLGIGGGILGGLSGFAGG